MNDSDSWIKDELLQAFYSVVSDYKFGTIDEEMMRDLLLRLAERYARSFGSTNITTDQPFLARLSAK